MRVKNTGVGCHSPIQIEVSGYGKLCGLILSSSADTQALRIALDSHKIWEQIDRLITRTSYKVLKESIGRIRRLKRAIPDWR